MLSDLTLPAELQQVIESGPFEWDGFIDINFFEKQDEKATVRFKVASGDEDIPAYYWELHIDGLQDYRVHGNTAEYIKIRALHPLLWQFTSPRTSLMFNGTPSQPALFLKELYAAHLHHTANWFPIETFLNLQQNVSGSPAELCLQGFGLFASGPRNCMEQYFTILERHGMKPHFLGDYGPEYEDPERPLHIVVIGKSYFIGWSFSFRKLLIA
jgi:hypothetical protein